MPRKRQVLMPKKPRAPRVTGRHLSAHATSILERTAQWKFERERFLADVDMAELAELEAVVLGPLRVVKPAIERTPASRTSTVYARDDFNIFLPKPKGKCPRCKLTDHPGMGCDELARWLRTARAVLAEASPRHPNRVS